MNLFLGTISSQPSPMQQGAPIEEAPNSASELANALSVIGALKNREEGESTPADIAAKLAVSQAKEEAGEAGISQNDVLNLAKKLTGIKDLSSLAARDAAGKGLDGEAAGKHKEGYLSKNSEIVKTKGKKKEELGGNFICNSKMNNLHNNSVSS